MNIIEGIHNIIISFDKLKSLSCSNENLKICIFGASSSGRELLLKLKKLEINVNYFVDNDKNKYGKKIKGIEIVSPEKLKDIKDVFIIISSLYIREIYKQLFDMGLGNKICFIPDQFLKEEEALNLDLEKNNVEKEYLQDKVLICSTDRLGDSASRMGIYQKYIEYFGSENVFFLTTQKSVFQLISIISDNVIFLDKFKYFNDKKYAYSFAYKINSIGFNKAVVLTISSQIFLQNLYNCKKYYCIDSPAGKYTLGPILEIYNFITNSNLVIDDIKPNISEYFNENKYKPSTFIPEDYVCFGMGASWEGRMYPVQKLVAILKYLIKNNLYVVLLGNGKIDEGYYSKIFSYINSDKLLNYVNKFTIQESAYVISKSKLFVGIESGLWNVSYALRKKSIVLYGGGDYGRFKHEDGIVSYICNNMQCYNCGWKCKYDYVKCVEDIEINDVLNNLKGHI